MSGTTWTTRTAPSTTTSLISVTYGIINGNGSYVAVSESGTNRVMTSFDGGTWIP